MTDERNGPTRFHRLSSCWRRWLPRVTTFMSANRNLLAIKDPRRSVAGTAGSEKARRVHLQHAESQALRSGKRRRTEPSGGGNRQNHDMSCFKGSRLERNDDTLQILLVSLLTLTIFLALFAFRSLDDNRLTSWQWAFSNVDLLWMLLVLLVAAAIAFASSSVSLPARRPALWLFIGSFVAAAIFWREPEVIVDSSRYFMQAKYLEVYGVADFLREWGYDLGAWTDLPLIPFLYGLIFSAIGEARLGIQVFTTLLFSGTVALTYLIGKTLWDQSVGLTAGLLLFGMPYLFTQVPLMLVDVPAMFFMTLAVFVTIEATRRGGTGLLVLSSLTITLAMMAKYSTWLTLSVLPFIFLSHSSYGWKTIFQRTSAIVFGAGLLLGTILLWKHDVIVKQLTFLLSYQLPGLQRWQESYISTFFFQIHPFITVAAVYSLYVALRKKDPKYLIVSWSVVLLIVLEVKRIRYMVVVLPMLALMASYGLRSIGNAKVRKYIVSSAVASALVIAFYAYEPFLRSTSYNNMKQAGEYLESIDADAVEVVVLPQVRSIINPAVSVPLLDLFTTKRIVYDAEGHSVPAPSSIEKSSLRFTWDYRSPGYYESLAGPVATNTAVVVILSDRRQQLPAKVAKRISGHRLSKEFRASTDVFRYRTIVRIYEPA